MVHKRPGHDFNGLSQCVTELDTGYGTGSIALALRLDVNTVE